MIGYRKRYLESSGKSEFLDKFIKHVSEVKVDWTKIKENIK